MEPTSRTETPQDRGGRGRAAAYVRMSTEHQQYSTENQKDVIRAFAEARNLDIVRVYADEGKSGLRLDGRDSLKALLRDAESGAADFSVILVYDVSRWGRFQDPDESASYEIRCKHAGVRVLYCAEQFENDGSPVSSIIKSVKRTMAGEYSRELSVKVHAGQCRQVRNGFRQGGPAGYGLRRVRVDQSGVRKDELKRGEQKAIQTDRVILVPGPPDELATVRAIYRQFVEEGQSESEIAAALNEAAIRTDRGTQWTRGTVHQILINDKYVGDNVWNRVSFKLKQERVRNPPASWIRADNAFEPIVERIIFEAARQLILARSYRWTDTDMLNALRTLLLRNGYLSGIVIDEALGCPSSSAYTSRFGSLLRTYDLIGYTPARDYRYVETNRRLRELHPEVVSLAEQAMAATGARVERDAMSGLLWVNEEFKVSLALSRCRPTAAGSNRWIIRFDNALRPDITIAVRMEFDAKSIRDYYLLPRIDVSSDMVRLGDHNDFGFEAYRYDDLSMLCHLARRVPLKGVSYE
ncbi:DNA invertase Pin-like site-specific DNA recombinase [Paraburkholderia sp. GV068]|uniref:recombinase family protein n=1 Tax=unclassified Paraburkholderia TaxID=2615204 RepID=UPI000D49D490|nr:MULTISPECIES: recombinase family protein [unclassified Paraburkholderia]PTR03805.1 DNA invertase Pin-like site-specific DNA recombinase [Paraburkholderia sp. GV072]PUB08763.1 DNA invertase Pin-like site-specific DNA recombinase [Paraburkholderia sp. GV068]